MEWFSSISSPLMTVTQNKDDDTSVLYHPTKENVVVEALRQLSMASVAHVKDDMNGLGRDLHRLAQLGVWFVFSNEGGGIVCNGSKSSFVLDVKVKKDLDSITVDLKKSVSEKAIEAFFQWAR
ncbi:hypothetical protein MTR67_035008 [Solanum verrucosum]|uniref:Uncharacterized protein n=1 Tax=Solanum verrucosum TaxID=315347 RepID=A0AAF0U9B3_SOLVR|nr:hypothetical protein MTR67_035008 [Solanum verrucosum]